MALPATTTAALLSSHASTAAVPLAGSFRLCVSGYARPLCRDFYSIGYSQISCWLSLRCGGRRRRLSEQLCLAVEGSEVALEEVEEEESVEATAAVDGGGEAEAEEGEEDDKRRKLYVVNLPWNFTAPEMRDLFGQCGTVKDVEIIKQKGGKGRGFAFITMNSAEEARAVIEKFDSYELQERIIRVEFAKSMKKPPHPAGATMESRHKIYVSNLAWKARSNNLREFFAGSFKPVSVRVVFDTPTGRAAGYGFVSFATEEEMEAAISELDGKELMGRPVRLKASQRKEG
ncbi:unnamed protein product [Spirodela intermedia]|uniref:RRM domain-containing protein n=1 Tax=Spirodela intermedia TaxID=51605 RepID=A0A7I8K8V6_SPIIN|nr:unnamed protein product [Spirodela intermedia]